MLLFRPLIVGVHHAKKFWMPCPRTAIECAKQTIHCLLRGAVDATLDYGLLLEKQRVQVSEDCVEALTAFPEKRTPVFTGNRALGCYWRSTCWRLGSVSTSL